MRKSHAFILMALLPLLALVPTAAFADQLGVFVSILPQQYFVQQIGGDRVRVEVMVPPGADPHTYEPKPSQMVALAKTKIYFAVGVNFEQTWLQKFAATNPAMQIVHTDAGIAKIPMVGHSHAAANEATPAAGHSQAHSGAPSSKHDHDHGALDPHIWLSPPLVKIQAKHIRDALVQADPANAAIYQANFERFSSELDALDAELKTTFAGKEGLEFIVFHPAWGYFAQTYGLKQTPIELEGKEPKPAQLQEIITHAREHHIRVIFAQPQRSSRSAETIARAIGGKVVFADPLALDWAANLRRQAASFDEVRK